MNSVEKGLRRRYSCIRGWILYRDSE